jgi:hypothetical protein
LGAGLIETNIIAGITGDALCKSTNVICGFDTESTRVPKPMRRGAAVTIAEVGGAGPG